MILDDVSEGTRNRILRIMELRNCSAIEAVEYSVSVGWLAAEHNEIKKTWQTAQRPASVLYGMEVKDPATPEPGFRGPIFDEPI